MRARLVGYSAKQVLKRCACTHTCAVQHHVLETPTEVFSCMLNQVNIKQVCVCVCVSTADMLMLLFLTVELLSTQNNNKAGRRRAVVVVLFGSFR